MRHPNFGDFPTRPGAPLMLDPNPPLVVHAEHMQAGSDKPTVLVYGHYDVQPVDPLELWISDPFEPEIRAEDLFARGASDMKGQVMASLRAAEAWLKTSALPLNIKLLIEGEEEIGSPPPSPLPA